MEFWPPNSSLNGLAHVKSARTKRESSSERPGDQSNDYSSVAYWYQTGLWPDQGLWDE